MTSKLPQIGDRIIWRKKKGVIVAQGWESEYLLLIPRSEYWSIYHKPTEEVIQTFYPCALALAKCIFLYASEWDWSIRSDRLFLEEMDNYRDFLNCRETYDRFEALTDDVRKLEREIRYGAINLSLAN